MSNKLNNEIFIFTLTAILNFLTEWLILTGLIHDAGKVMALWGEEQWSVVGDTFPVGCRFQESCVFHNYFDTNPDNNNPKYK